EGKNGSYQVAYMDLPIPADESEEEQHMRLEAVRDALILQRDGLMVKERKILLAGRDPGQDFFSNISKPHRVLRGRLYLVNRRRYQVVVVGTESWTSSEDATKFLDSFTLTP